MSGIAEYISDLEFMYESDASSSFLVIRCEKNLIEYQIRMLENNGIRYIVPLEVVKKEGVNHFYCNITSKIPLSLYLKRHKLCRDGFLKLLLNLCACINDSTGFLLYPANFVLIAEYVYIDPETLDVIVVYIPANIERSAGGSLQSLVSDLLMQHIHAEGFGSGNLVQRILSEVKSEMFNIKGFMTLMNELLYGQESKSSSAHLPDEDFCSKTLEKNSKNDKIEENEENGNRRPEYQKKLSPIVIIAVLLQFVMGGVVYLCRGFLDNVGENPAATYAAVIMIVLAADVLIFRKLHAMGMLGLSVKKGNEAIGKEVQMEIDCVEGGQSGESMISRELTVRGGGVNLENSITKMESVFQMAGTTDFTKDENVVLKGSAASVSSMQQLQQEGALYSQKTEVLGKHAKGVRMLKSKLGHAGDRDIIIDKDEFIIGRLAGHVDHVLFNNAVGKLHAELICKDGSCYVRDLNSINGTFINNIRIESNKEVELEENDDLQFANCEFVYCSGQG